MSRVDSVPPHHDHLKLRHCGVDQLPFQQRLSDPAFAGDELAGHLELRTPGPACAASQLPILATENAARHWPYRDADVVPVILHAEPAAIGVVSQLTVVYRITAGGNR